MRLPLIVRQKSPSGLQARRIKRPVNGVLLFDKPPGFSSNQALQKVKWLYQAEKAGHTGTLDPLATGLLPICFGEATKFAQYLTDADKTYMATIKLGKTTSTGDAEGEVLAVKPVRITAAELTQVVGQFLGDIDQVPPMYSALKHEGQALYTYARAGVQIARKPRSVTIKAITVNAFAGDEVQLTVTCSKGTYIRTLAEDIGNMLGCGAHLTALRRTKTADFDLAASIALSDLEQLTLDARDRLLLAVDSTIASLPKILLTQDAAYYLLQGQAVWQPGFIPSGDLRLYDEQRQFLGLGTLQDDGKVAPKRLLKQAIKTNI